MLKDLEKITEEFKNELEKEGFNENVSSHIANFLKTKYSIFFCEKISDEQKEEHTALSYFATLNRDKIKNFNEFLDWYATLTDSWNNKESNKLLKKQADTLFQISNKTYNKIKEKLRVELKNLPNEDCAIFPLSDKMSNLYGKTVRDGGMFIEIMQELPNGDAKEFISKIFSDKEEVKKERDFQFSFSKLFEDIIRPADYSEKGSVLTYPRKEKDYSDIYTLEEKVGFELGKKIISRMLDIGLTLTEYKINPSKIEYEPAEKREPIKIILDRSKQNRNLFLINEEDEFTEGFLYKEFYSRIANAANINLEKANLEDTLSSFSANVISKINKLPKLILHGDFDPRNVLKSEEGFHIHDFKSYFGPYTFDIFEFLEKTGLKENGDYSKYKLFEGLIEESNKKAREKGILIDKSKIREDYDLTRIMLGLREASIFLSASLNRYDSEKNRERYKKSANEFYTLALRKLEEYGMDETASLIKRDIGGLFTGILTDNGKIPEKIDGRAFESGITGGFAKAIRKRARFVIKEKEDLEELIGDEFVSRYGKKLSKEEIEGWARLINPLKKDHVFSRESISQFIGNMEETAIESLEERIMQQYLWMRENWRLSPEDITLYSKRGIIDLLSIPENKFDKFYEEGQLPIIKKQDKFGIIWGALYEIGHVRGHVFYSPERIAQSLGMNTEEMTALYKNGLLPLAENLGYFRIIGGTENYGDLDSDHPDLENIRITSPEKEKEWLEKEKKVQGKHVSITKDNSHLYHVHKGSTDLREPFLKGLYEKGVLELQEDNPDIENILGQYEKRIAFRTNGKKVWLEKKVNSKELIKDGDKFIIKRSEKNGRENETSYTLTNLETFSFAGGGILNHKSKKITTKFNIAPDEDLITRDGKTYVIKKGNDTSPLFEINYADLKSVKNNNPVREFVNKNSENKTNYFALCRDIITIIEETYSLGRHIDDIDAELRNPEGLDFVLNGQSNHDTWEHCKKNQLFVLDRIKDNLSGTKDQKSYSPLWLHSPFADKQREKLYQIGHDEIKKAGYGQDYETIQKAIGHINYMEGFRKKAMEYSKKRHERKIKISSMGEELQKNPKNEGLLKELVQESNNLEAERKNMIKEIYKFERYYYTDLSRFSCRDMLAGIKNKYETMHYQLAKKLSEKAI